MTSNIDSFLLELKLQKYSAVLKNYGIQNSQDISRLTPQDWEHLKVLPFHRTKLIQKAAFLKEMEIIKLKQQKIGQSVSEILCNYKFSSSGAYTTSGHLPESLNNFQPAGYGVANSADSWMMFSFIKPVKIYGVIIGNNIGVQNSWNSTHLQGVQIQVRQLNSQNWKTVTTIAGMPNLAKTAYLATMQQSNVQEVRFWKNAYFSTSYVRFV